jgi:hypothetical protein
VRAGTALDRTEAFVRPTGGARQQAAGMAETRIGAIDARVREMVTELRRLLDEKAALQLVQIAAGVETERELLPVGADGAHG